MPTEAQSKKCPMCESDRSDELFRATNGYPILRCQQCQLAFTDDREAPPPETLYPHFDQSETVGLKKLRSAVSLFLHQRAGFVRSVKPSGRILDFGCGNGAFARHMSGLGYDSVGLEPFSLGETQRSERLELIQAPLESAAPTLGTFDVITMWQVLEHLSQPIPVLKRLAELLSPDGVMVVSVPNFRSWQSQVFRGGWFHLDPPRHLLHFEPNTLTDCLARAGLTRVAERRFLPEYGSSGWIQSTLNRVLPHENYLYELVKDRGALSSMGRGSFAAHLAGSVLAGAPLFALSIPVEAAASLGDNGAALTFAARRSHGP